MKRNIKFALWAFFAAIVPSNFAYADIELNCEFNKYAVAQGASMETIKSYIPESQNHLLKENKASLYLDYGLEGEITKDTSKRVEFRYEFVGYNTNITIKYVLFRTTNKTVVYMQAQGYQDLGPVWGICQENKNASSDYIRFSDATDEQVCNEVMLLWKTDGVGANIQITNEDGSVKNQEWIDEAKRRWGQDYGTMRSKCENILGTSQSPSATFLSSPKIDKAKSTCTDLGFTAGTEKHGECVLRLMDN